MLEVQMLISHYAPSKALSVFGTTNEILKGKQENKAWEHRRQEMEDICLEKK